MTSDPAPFSSRKADWFFVAFFLVNRPALVPECAAHFGADP